MTATTARSTPQVAFIREAECIGCTKCFNACPVDAIVGAARFLHSVLAADCTGCGLCLTPCPVDCIELRPTEQAIDSIKAEQAKQRKIQRLTAQAAPSRTSSMPSPSTTNAPPAPTPSNHTTEGHSPQKLKIAANMTQIALTKAEQQLKRRPSPALENQVAKLRLAAQQAQERLQQAEHTAPAPTTTAAAKNDALQQAKCQLVAQRMALKQAIQQGVTASELASVQAKLEAAEQALQDAEAQTERPKPERTLSYKHPITPQWRDLKTELALARAALHQQKHQAPTDPSRWQQAQARLQAAEQQLAQYLTEHP